MALLIVGVTLQCIDSLCLIIIICVNIICVSVSLDRGRGRLEEKERELMSEVRDMRSRLARENRTKRPPPAFSVHGS